MNNPLTLAFMKAEIEKKISAPVLQDVLEFMDEQKLKPWGLERPPGFINTMTILTIYHDQEMIGYQQLVRRAVLEFNISDKSIRHNASKVRFAFFEWAKDKIIEGDQNSWREAAIDVPRPKNTEGPILWADSTDFPLERRAGRGRKSSDWSYKLNKPGQRYMSLQDAKGFVHVLFGGYSPKVHDSHFMTLFANWCEEHLDNAVIVADQHFQPLENRFHNIRVYTPLRRPPKPQPESRGQRVKVLTKKQEQHNKTQRARLDKRALLLAELPMVRKQNPARLRSLVCCCLLHCFSLSMIPLDPINCFYFI